MSAVITLVLGALLLRRLEAARNDHLAEFAGLRWAGSRFPVAAGAGSLLGTRQRQRRAKDAMIVGVLYTVYPRDAEYSVPGHPLSCPRYY